jgi:hypothetical protein
MMVIDPVTFLKGAAAAFKGVAAAATTFCEGVKAARAVGKALSELGIAERQHCPEPPWRRAQERQHCPEPPWQRAQERQHCPEPPWQRAQERQHCPEPPWQRAQELQHCPEPPWRRAQELQHSPEPMGYVIEMG